MIHDVDVTVVEIFVFFFQAEDGIRDVAVTGVQTCALPISRGNVRHAGVRRTLPRVPSGSLPLGQRASSIGLNRYQMRPARSPAPSACSAWLKIGRASCRERV